MVKFLSPSGLGLASTELQLEFVTAVVDNGCEPAGFEARNTGAELNWFLLHHTMN